MVESFPSNELSHKKIQVHLYQVLNKGILHHETNEWGQLFLTQFPRGVSNIATAAPWPYGQKLPEYLRTGIKAELTATCINK